MLYIKPFLRYRSDKNCQLYFIFSDADFYVAEDLLGPGLLQRILQRDVVLMNGKDRG